VIHPLKTRHWFLREMTCFLVGHKWKHSPRVPSQYYDVDDIDSISYVERKRSRNIFYDDVAWWVYKCPRCRAKTVHSWPDNSWWVELAEGLRGGYLTMKSSWRWARVMKAPLHWRVLFSLADGIHQCVLHFEHVHAWVLDLTTGALEWMYEKMDN
jgi:hypothetical protein